MTLEKMAPTPDEITIPTSIDGKLVQRKTWWRRFGGDAFLFSLALHIGLALIAIFWVVTTYVDKKNDTDTKTFSTGAGGGNQGDRAKIFEQRIKPKNARNMVSTPAKIVAKGTGGIVLPEMPGMNFPAITDGNLNGGISKGDGTGSGGGRGDGQGIGIGNAKNLVTKWTMFGGNFREPNMLEGTLYDLKRGRDGKEKVSLNDQMARIEAMKEAMTGLRRVSFKKEWMDQRYFQAPQKLYATHIAIPPMDAGVATAAFNCQDIIQAPGWLAYYEGWFTPPASGEYRFAGIGDDGLIVAVNNKMVFWSPWPEYGRQTWFPASREWLPADAYKENGALPELGNGGRHFGEWIKLEKGKTYWMQIVFAEATGGLFSAELQIQKRTDNSKEIPGTNTELPLFKMAPISDEEMALKRATKQRWTKEGPDFGCEINGIRQPPASR